MNITKQKTPKHNNGYWNVNKHNNKNQNTNYGASLGSWVPNTMVQWKLKHIKPLRIGLKWDNVQQESLELKWTTM
jgi:hypothetical protein